MRKRCLCILLICIFALSGCASSTKSFKKASLAEGDKNFSTADEFYKVCSDNGFELMINGKTTEVAVKNTVTGRVWYSQPANRSEDTIATGSYSNLLNSPINFLYVNSKMKNETVDTYSKSIELQQYTFEKIDKGIRVNYLVGESQKEYLAPEIVSIERFNELISKLDMMDQAQLKAYYRLFSLNEIDDASKVVYSNQYPILKERDVYIINGSRLGDQEIPEYLLQTLDELFRKAGYSLEKMKEDNKANLFETVEKPDFTISVSIEYTLDNGNLVVNIPIDSLNYDQNEMNLVEMSVLPFFGAAGNDKTGYMFVPDGCGALIYLNGNKKGINAYNNPIYGADKVIDSDIDNPADIYLPVFGVKSNDTAFLGIIESGAANADICAQVSGKETSYNQIYSKFRTREKSDDISSIMNLSSNMVFQKENFDYDMRIRYVFLEDSKADYVGMANSYAEYLERNKGILNHKQDDGLMMHIQAIASTSCVDNVMGIPIKSAKSTTSYNQLTEMMKKYISNNIKNLDVSYIGWYNKGTANTVSNEVELVKALGSKKEFNELIDFMNKNKIKFYPQYKLQYVTNTDGFSVNKKASRNLSNMTAYAYEYSLATLQKNEDKRRVVVSPKYYDDITEDFLKDYSKYKINGIAATSCGTDLNSDFNEKNPIYRQTTANKISEQLKKFKDKKYSVSVSGANSYALSSADLVVDVPMTSSGNYILDVDVPFYQIVLHGRVPYTSLPINKEGNYDKSVLKLIEYGSSPSFEFMYEDNIELVNTDSPYYSANFESWYEDSVKLYKKLNDIYGNLNNEKIVGHIICSENVYCTEYSNGTKIYTNYNQVAIAVEGLTIDANGYRVVRSDEIE